MEFNEKLQELRKQKGLTQEELAEKLYVSRAAISKWESGRGYPSIDSLRDIAKFFSVTVDQLISPDQMLNIAEENQKQTEKRFKDLIFGLLDICASLLLFLPLLSEKTDEYIRAVSLLALDGVAPYLKVAYFFAVMGTVIIGILTLALQSITSNVWSRIKSKISLALSIAAVLIFIISLQPYAASFVFVMLVIKAAILLTNK